MRKYGESKTTRIMTATVPYVTSGLGLRKFRADGFLLTRVYKGQAVGRVGVAIRVDTSMTQLCVFATIWYSVPVETCVATQFIVC